ncbi:MULTISPECIES: copper resistance system multicopper oxidase [Pseudomonadaceae]|jgi:CopA family copper-resistance protein|uniref:Copper resistance system multicopper oxidase n=1 Tax=Aquipseudomonas alcaligenes TaxID=43263 RepID=A0AB73I0T5_AQUAC|nr:MULTISPECIES: copper resistance system multicopper oxidase [Pseudomonas aeruginosa group]AYK23470.1 copper resistance system multicopper oxidase [Pseudomonas aeruginosa]KYO79642.1 Copper resistance protein A precursor [Pseudomonas aeruginosa]MDH0143707.1 copper resistance system multicopper oxidase [Pseudomonas alcaligenes]HBO4914839.1 copper resistance system multicopper oxidase [Pseudomonas aeruginosa]HBO4948537.1 copper resistance system multicopper oxidase [Pseudomonas aeruginosa]
MQSKTTRRTFVKGLAATGIIGGLGLWRTPVWAVNSPGQPNVLTGNEFDLFIGETPVNITGAARTAMTINGSLPGPILRWREGDTVTLRVRNRLKEDTSIHWHGIILPANMDGVPGLSFHGIAPDGMYEYKFKVNQNGTYWYHSHSGLQEQVGVYGALVIDAKEPEPFSYDRDYVVLLSDWTDENPTRVLAKLKKQSDYYNQHKRTVGDFIDDVSEMGWSAAVADRKMWAEMKMSPTDLADVSGYTYTYLMNGQAPNGNWTGIFKPGEKIRLRFINASAMTYFDVRIPGLKMTVVAADGLHVKPVSVDEFRIAVAETYDVIVEPDSEQAYTVFAQSMDRTGYARGTLAVQEGLSAPVPSPDPRPLIAMGDMGMDHGSMGGMDHGNMAGMDQGNMAGMDHGSMQGGMAGMDHSQMAGMDHSNMAGMAGMAGNMQAHPASETNNPLVDMQTMTPTHKLDDPGIGLRDNGRRVLTYSDLRSTFPDPDGREPSRTIELHLTGHMEKFSWSFDGIKFSDAEPLRLKYGERVRITLVNDTMMTHPIHLHGMWSDLEDANGNFLVRKHTIDMPPGSKRSYRVTADALGRWAYHCHLLLHMEMGMFREVRVDE